MTETEIYKASKAPAEPKMFRINVPAGAHRPEDQPTYSTYKLVGRMARDPDDNHTNAARDRARAKFGPTVQVFATARFWVVHLGG